MPKNTFVYHRPNAEQIERISKIRAACMVMEAIINEECLPSRERSLAHTKLEEVSMWANKSIVMEEGTEVA
jgi:hypothetical protein